MTAAFGPLMVNVEGLELTADDRNVLAHPLVGGLILFARNYQSSAQISALCTAIREASNGPILIAVDHEGGRVQRFSEPFTRIPPMRALGELHDDDPEAALQLAKDIGWLIATELGAVGIDFSFTPILDIDRGINKAIAGRAFHRDPMVIAELARALTEGLHSNGMAAVGKHFPGHGSVAVDSHVGIPVDERDFQAIDSTDLEPFKALIASEIEGIMPAHIIFSKVDELPAGFSPHWLRTVLREQLGFTGAVFSDDLSMQAAHVAGDVLARVNAAAEAGNDMLLVCNVRADVSRVLDEYTDRFASGARDQRLAAMQRQLGQREHKQSRVSAIQEKIQSLEVS